MVNVISIVKECEIREVLCYLMGGLPKKKYTKMLERYYSLYCMLLESWAPEKSHEMIITGFRQTKRVFGQPVYEFFTVRDYSDAEKLHDSPVNWSEIVKEEAELFVPKYFLEMVDENLLMTEILYQLEKAYDMELPKRQNRKLFESVWVKSQNEKSQLSAIEKSLEQALNYQADRSCVKNAIREYYESNGLVIRWGDVLKEEGESFIERSIVTKEGKERLTKQLLTDSILPGNISPVYKYFIRMDLENIPDVGRCHSRKSILMSNFDELELSDYQHVVDEHMRIVVERNVAYEKLPVVYVCDQYGEKSALSEVSLSQLLCMDVCVTDDKITDPYQVLAIILFYMEYPLRVRRIQKEYMHFAIYGMMNLYEQKVRERYLHVKKQ